MADKVIAIKGVPQLDESQVAAEAITPGHLLDLDANGYKKHAGAAKNAEPVFALERDEMGDDIDVAYAAGDTVKAGCFKPGDIVNALLASGSNVSIGSYLESKGDGTLRALATDAATDDTQRRAVVARSLQAKTPTASTRVRVRIV